jgi:hypothetical protein
MQQFTLKRAFNGVMVGSGAAAMWGLDRLGLMKPMMRRMSRRFNSIESFQGYQPTEHDVLVCTYFKSGTNWMMQIVHQIAWRGQGEFDHIHTVVPWPDAPSKRFGIPLQDSSVWQAAPTEMRAIKTHLRWEAVPYTPDARYITVIRDPKDVFVSSYHFMRTLGMPRPLMPSVERWLDHYLSPEFPFGGSWATYVAEYWRERQRPNVEVFSYKAMKRDLAGSVRRVAQLMNVELSKAEFDLVCERSSFAYMKGIDHKFDPTVYMPWGRKQGGMIRSGKHGGSSELLTLEQQRRIDRHFMDELKAIGSDFPYAEFCEVV